MNYLDPNLLIVRTHSYGNDGPLYIGRWCNAAGVVLVSMPSPGVDYFFIDYADSSEFRIAVPHANSGLWTALDETNVPDPITRPVYEDGVDYESLGVAALVLGNNGKLEPINRVGGSGSQVIVAYRWHMTGTGREIIYVISPTHAATTSLPGFMAPAMVTKLNGIATGATVNSSDAALLSRTNHTGTQSAGTITGLAAVATSGVYNDLTGKPALATVATSGSYNDLGDKPSIQLVQRTRAQTDSSGNLTWTFPSAYGGGITPVVSVTVEDGTSGILWNHRITSISNTAVTIKLDKAQAVTVLGVAVLGVQSSPQAFVHLTAVAP